MGVFLSILIGLVIGVFIVRWLNLRKNRNEIVRYSVTPADLRSMLDHPDSVLLVDVRLPLDLLADPHIIPGSVRLAPKEVQANPLLVPKDRDVVFYCTFQAMALAARPFTRPTRLITIVSNFCAEA